MARGTSQQETARHQAPAAASFQKPLCVLALFREAEEDSEGFADFCLMEIGCQAVRDPGLVAHVRREGGGDRALGYIV